MNLFTSQLKIIKFNSAEVIDCAAELNKKNLFAAEKS